MPQRVSAIDVSANHQESFYFSKVVKKVLAIDSVYEVCIKFECDMFKT